MSRKACCCATFTRPTFSGVTTRQGMDRVGLIDFQDAMIGPSAYDVASLIFDARVTIAPELQDICSPPISTSVDAGGADLTRPGSARRLPSWRRSEMPRYSASSSASMNATANLSICSTCPAFEAYLNRVIDHPALAPVKDWCEKAGVLTSEI